MHRNLHAQRTEGAVWEVVRIAALNPERMRAALKGRRAKLARKGAKKDRGHLEAILARLGELAKGRDGLIDLALDGPLSKAELAERLAPLDAQIRVLEEEARILRCEEDERTDAEENERMMLRRLEAGFPEDLDALTPSHRRELYKALGLTVLANRDGSLTLRWMVDLELGVIRCQEERTSTR